MKTLNRKVILSIMLVILLTPAAVSAGVYFMESIDEDAKEIAVTKPCILDYPKRSCPAGKVPQRLCPSDSRFFQDCGCDTDVYKYDASSCTDNKTPSGTTCDGKFAGCACDTTKYKYDSTNCTNGKTLSGNTCDGKYDACGCPAEYSKTCPSPMIGGETACDGKYKSCKCPTNYVTCDNGGDVGASQCTEENGTVKWSSCKAATCVDGGFQSSVPVNQTCTQVPYNSLTCYENCRALTCADNNFVSSCPSGQTGTPVIYANLNCYKDCKASSCEAWVKANYPDVVVGSVSSGKTSLILNNTNFSYGLNIGSGKLVGPKYFNNELCQSMVVPTITVTSKNSAGVTMSGGMISDLKIVFDPVQYSEGSNTVNDQLCFLKSSVCDYGTPDSSTAQNHYNNMKSACEYWSGSTSDDRGQILQSICNGGGVCNGSSDYKICSLNTWDSCSCVNQAQQSCYILRDFCTINSSGIVEGSGTLNNVDLSSKNNMEIGSLVSNGSGTMNFTGVNTLKGPGRTLSIVVKGIVTVTSGTTSVNCGRGVNLSGTLNVEKEAKLNLAYGEWDGIYVRSDSAAVNVRGVLNINSFGTGGKYNNDISFGAKGSTLNIASGGCYITSGGMSGADGYYGYNQVYSGYLKYVSGSNIKVKGSCGKASSSGSILIQSQEKPNQTYGTFSSKPAAFSGSCDSVCN